MGKQGRRAAIDVMPFLIGHPDERVRGVAAEALEEWGEARHLARALRVLDDPRTGAAEAIEPFLVDLDRMEEVAHLVLETPDATPAQLAWAFREAPGFGDSEGKLLWILRRGHPSEVVRRDLAWLAARSSHPDTVAILTGFLGDESAEVAGEALRAW
jgi:HEAT repeat protein